MVKFNAIVDRREDRQELSSYSCFHFDKNDTNKKWMLRLDLDHDPRNAYLNASALNEIQSYPQVDALYLPTLCLHNQGILFELQELMMKQDRPWKVTLDFDAEQVLASSQMELYEVISFFSTVPNLALKGWMAQDFLPILAEQLAALTSLEQLDLERFPMRPSFLVALYEYFPQLCEKIPHVHLSLEETPSMIDAPPLSISFSPVAVKHLRSLTISVKSRNVLADAFSWLHAACDTLSNLECLELEIVGVPGPDLRPFVERISAFIASPTCCCTKLSLLFLRLQGRIPKAAAQSLYQALDCNRSLEAIKLRGMNAFPNWTDMYSYLSSKTCLIRHLSIGNWEREITPDLSASTPAEDGNSMTKQLEYLLRWQVQMRPTRLVTVSISPVNTAQTIIKIRFVSMLHARWRQGQGKSAVPLSGMLLARPLWSCAIQSVDESQDPALRDVSLDAIYHLLQIWLSGESELPVKVAGLQEG